MDAQLRAGTRIEVSYIGMDGKRHWQSGAKIGRRTKDTCSWAEMPGWYPVTFADGARLTLHESGFRVVSNR
jgi:hypothetical protein